MTRCQRSLLGFKNDHIDYHFRVLLSLYLRMSLRVKWKQRLFIFAS
jgi:hypothetical protein